MRVFFIQLSFVLLWSFFTYCSDENVNIPDNTTENDEGNSGNTDKEDDKNDDETIDSRCYYVSSTGNDNNDGSIERPLATIKKAMSLIIPGDTVYLRGGIYHELVIPQKSGEKNKQITIKSYRDEEVKIDGTGMAFNGWGNALLQIRDISYITVEGLHLCNVTNTEKNSDPEGVYITGNSKYVTLRKLKIYNIKSSCTKAQQDAGDDWRSAHAIYVAGYNTSPISGLLVEKCEIYDIHSGTSETFSLVGNVIDFTIQDNEVHDVENIGIIVAGGDNLNPGGDISVNYARNGIIRRNKVYRCSHQNSTDYWGEGGYGAIGIYVCGGASTIIEQNEVWGCDRGIGLVSESNIFPTKDCIVRNNIVYNNYRTGIYMGDYIGYTIGGTKGCYILNNTLYYNNQVGGALDGNNNSAGIDDTKDSEGEIRLTANCTNNTIMNNIIYAVTDRDIFIRKYDKSGSNNKIGYNIYYSESLNKANHKWIWDGATFTSFEDYKRVSGDINSIYDTNPKFINPSLEEPNFDIMESSPAINKGFNNGIYFNGTLDFSGNPRFNNNNINIGAYQ